MLRSIVIVGLTFVLHWSAASRASGGEDLTWSPLIETSATVAGAALWLSVEALREDIAPNECRWCDRDDEGRNSLNAFDSSGREQLRWRDPLAADAWSNGFAVATPVAAFGGLALLELHDGALRRLPADALFVGEAIVLSSLLNTTAKLAFARERPFVHFMAETDRPHTETPSDNNLSFYSGHASLAFSLATSAGTVATLRGYRLAPVLWVVGVGLASTTSYLRVAADRHYLSDVLVGAAAGTAVGVGVPLLLHERGDGPGVFPRLSLVPLRESSLVLASWRL